MNATRLASVRPLVRYVDEGQAVIDTHIALHPPLPDAQPLDTADVLLEIIGGDGSIDEQRVHLQLKDNAGVMRMQVVRPERWWPAGMGEQSLYQIRVSVLAGNEVVDSRDVTLGFTSVR